MFFDFAYPFRMTTNFLMIKITVMAYMKQLLSSSSLFLGLIVAFLLDNHLGVSIYAPPLIKSILNLFDYI